MKILLAEDDDVFRLLLGTLLFEDGYDVVAAPDGMKAWERLDGEGADLCVFDVDMPGMTGIDLLKRLRNDDRFSGLPVIMLTVKALVEDQLAGYKAGADEYIPKPVDADILLARIEALTRKTGKRKG